MRAMLALLLLGSQIINGHSTAPSTTHIHLDSTSMLDKNGYLSHASLKHLLTKADKDCPTPLFGNIQEIRQLSEEQQSARWKTSQLFSVTTAHASFIIKGMKEGAQEISNLAKAVSLHTYQFPKADHQPHFIFPVRYLSYTDQQNNKHYLSVMPKAPGTSLEKLMEAFAQKPGDTAIAQTIAAAYFDVGATMSLFYRAHKPPITHGDFHHGNIFYDQGARQVVLIDNERNHNDGKQGIARDVAFLLMKSLYVAQWTKPAVVKRLPLQQWYSLTAQNFVKGYVSVLDSQERTRAYNFLKTSLMNYIDHETGINWYNDRTMLGFSHREYMESVLRELAR